MSSSKYDIKDSIVRNFRCSHIVESVDVSNSGSFISVIHGTSARYMVNRTNSVSTAFQQLHNFTDPCN